MKSLCTPMPKTDPRSEDLDSLSRWCHNPPASQADYAEPPWTQMDVPSQIGDATTLSGGRAASVEWCKPIGVSLEALRVFTMP